LVNIEARRKGLENIIGTPIPIQLVISTKNENYYIKHMSDLIKVLEIRMGIEIIPYEEQVKNIAIHRYKAIETDGFISDVITIPTSENVEKNEMINIIKTKDARGIQDLRFFIDGDVNKEIKIMPIKKLKKGT